MDVAASTDEPSGSTLPSGKPHVEFLFQSNPRFPFDFDADFDADYDGCS
jgi:hypothetical protein